MRASVSAALLSLVLATSGAAQLRPGGIAGTVKDSLGVPIPDVEVTAIAASRTVRTDSAGNFVLGDITSGKIDVSFRRLAYSPAIVLITVPPADTTEIEVTLGVAAQQLTGVVVQASPDKLRQLVAFEARRKRGIGADQRRPFTLGQSEIEAIVDRMLQTDGHFQRPRNEFFHRHQAGQQSERCYGGVCGIRQR